MNVWIVVSVQRFVCGSRALFTEPTNFFFSKIFIKNESHITIHTFKIYFVTVFLVFIFQFSAINSFLNKNSNYGILCYSACGQWIKPFSLYLSLDWFQTFNANCKPNKKLVFLSYIGFELSMQYFSQKNKKNFQCNKPNRTCYIAPVVIITNWFSFPGHCQ